MDVKIKFCPYEKLKVEGIESIMKDLKKNTIIMIDAKLHPSEEAELIEATMRNVSSKFSGIELDSLDISDKDQKDTVLEKIKEQIVEFLTGKKRGITLIGPADIITKIEKKPDDLLLHMK